MDSLVSSGTPTIVFPFIGSSDTDATPFEDYQPFTFNASGVDIFGVKGGNGPPLLLLHGHPQTHEIWHRLAKDLAQHFTVIATDLRGYGASGKPPSDEHPHRIRSASWR